MKKVILEKDEEIADAIDKILAEPDTTVTLVVPRGSAIGRSARNFHLLKREMDSTGRQLEIESVDEQILALAKDAKILGRHPLLNRASGGSTSDIVAVAGRRASEVTLTIPSEEKSNGKKKVVKGKRADDEEDAVRIEVREEESAVEVPVSVSEDEDDGSDEDEDETEKESTSASFFAGDRFFKSREVADDDSSSGEPRSWRWLGWTVAMLVILVGLLFGVTKVFGHATVAIDFVKTPWQTQATFTGDKSVALPNPVNDTIPAQVFSENKNVTQLFPASGSASVSLKAQGTITIYNAYSSAPQELVATTRFVTPDGKIFRLVNTVTVPGATVSGGQITPSSINAPIVADQPGPDYNVDAVAKLTVPGFASTPKANGFYGAIASGTSGGFVGTRAVPTAADITAAKASTTAILQTALQSTNSFSIPSNFKILDGASNVQITQLTVSTTTDANGNFSVFGQVTYQAIGFDETMVKATLLADAQATESSSTFSALTINYSNVKPDFVNGRVTFTVAAQGSLEPIFMSDAWKAGIAGQPISAARAALSALPQLQDGTISVWPVWLWNIPANTDKITVNVD